MIRAAKSQNSNWGGQAGQDTRKDQRAWQIPHTSSPRPHVHAATACHFIIFIFIFTTLVEVYDPLHHGEEHFRTYALGNC